MSIKRVIPVLLIFLSTIGLGVFYNTYLVEDPWHTSMQIRYMQGLLLILMFVIQACCIYSLCAPYFKKYKSKFPVLLSSIMILAVLLYVLRIQIFGVGYINILIMLYVYPLVFLGIKEQFQSKHGLINTTVLFATLMSICLLVSDIKMLLFTGVSFIVIEFVAIMLFADTEKRKWYWHTGILTIVSLFALIGTIVLNWSIFERRIAGFFNPDTVLEYRMLLDWIGKCKLISSNLNTIFVDDINSTTTCIYSHIMTSLGIIPTLLIIFSQLYMVCLMFKNSIQFSDDNRKFLGMISSVLVAVHLFFSLYSSFYGIPMVGYGAPVIVGTGLCYSFAPLLLYFCLEFIEIYLKPKMNSNKQIKKYC